MISQNWFIFLLFKLKAKAAKNYIGYSNKIWRQSVRKEMLSRINYNLEAPQERERMLTQSDMIWVVLISPVLRTMTN